jgi:hypothetical protein
MQHSPRKPKKMTAWQEQIFLLFVEQMETILWNAYVRRADAKIGVGKWAKQTSMAISKAREQYLRDKRARKAA